MRGRARRRGRRVSAPQLRRSPCGCGCGGGAAGVRERLAEPGRLMVGGSRDPAETRADARAGQVTADAPAVAHRMCKACQAEQDAARRSPRAAPAMAPGATPARAGRAAEAAVRSLGPGWPLQPAERAVYEPRLGAGLGTVRLHEDAAADRAARAIDARAFTLGRDVAFAAGARAQGGPALMAHELAHAVEDAPAIRRSIKVLDHDKPIPGDGQTRGDLITDDLRKICLEGETKPRVDSGGAVRIDPDLCGTDRPVVSSGCGCLCELTGSDNEWRIHIRDHPDKKGFPHTNAEDQRKATRPGRGGSGGDIFMVSTNDPKEYAYGTVEGKFAISEHWELLAHELCGHARLANQGTHPVGEVTTFSEKGDTVRQGHSTIVPMINKIREENFPGKYKMRGSRIQDPYCGESFERLKGESGDESWKGSDFVLQCIEARQIYQTRMREQGKPGFNRLYKLPDKMP